MLSNNPIFSSYINLFHIIDDFVLLKIVFFYENTLLRNIKIALNRNNKLPSNMKTLLMSSRKIYS